MSQCLGMLTAELFIPESHSLKDRRSVVTSLKERIRNRYNVSISEAGGAERWQRADFSVACVADTERAVEHVLHGVIRLIESDGRCELLRPRIEYYA